MYDVITVGSSTIDAFAKVASDLVKIKSAQHTESFIAYPSGSKIIITNLVFLSGGGGTNTAVAMSRLGLKVGYAGKVGNDGNKTLILEQLKKEKIDFLGAKGKGNSGYSVILDSLEGDRTILAYKGVNDQFEYKEINLKKLKTKWFYFSSMINRSFETLEKLAVFAEKNRIKIAFNPSNYLAEKGRLYLKEVLSRTSLLVLNKEEAVLIGENLEMKELIASLMALGPKQVIITNGKEGAYTIDDNRLFHVIPKKANPKETTGAGDAFASTFLAGRIKGHDTGVSLKLASCNASSVIMYQGAKTGLLKWKELLSVARKTKIKTEIKKI